MQINARQAELLLLGDHRFTQLGFSMMVTRLKVLYAKEPSREVLMKAVGEINAFLGKFKNLMANDIKTITDL